jgi:general secretion pathway protein L
MLDPAHDQYEWVMFGSQGEILRAGMDNIAQLPVCNVNEVIVPGQLVSYVQITAPKVSDKKLIEILPFMIEDKLLTPPEDIHTVITQRQNNMVTVAIIQKAWLQKLIQALASYHLNPKYIMPDFLLIAHATDTWAIAQKDNTLIVNTGPAQGFALTLADTAADTIINLLHSRNSC